ncbi:hypothetical protein PBT90_13685 [Algoriphagus halophytocola]|uniref:Uncharacterized protein n=1 Tax=Algoriphagus halophytocola TaxID=2991499 RepID=A0ABY6MKY9_9BACT|nr:MULTISPECIES: hypothetical protein [unclassified Algoriphagus]UZD24440.1 hypothetical protein OM944_08040 [Algoriphagus sp. TR-M5]WBL41804.1 hypothetical protein PBT90_13685 [Algoriphagus sp. TR-M9]
MSKAAVRTIVILFWAGLFFQVLLIHRFKTEPYPSIRFPSFGDTGQTVGIKNINQYEIYLHTDQNQDSIQYSLDQFIPDLSYKKPTLELIASNYRSSQERTPLKIEFEEWLSKNLRKNFPDNKISKLSILEVQSSYNLSTDEYGDDRSLINYYTIELQSNE